MEFLKKVISSPAFKEILRLLVAALAGALSSGCGLVGVSAPDSPAAAKFACQVEAFEAVVPAPVAEDLAMAALRHDFDYIVAVLLRMEVAPEDILSAADAFRACDAVTPAQAAPEAPAALAPELTRT